MLRFFSILKGSVMIMVKENAEDIDIKKIISMSNLKVHFQPIVSVVKKLTIGLEGISIGSLNDNNEVIPMDVLYKYASKEKMDIDLDRLYRQKAVQDFINLYKSNKEMLLFIDINMPVISRFVGSGVIINLIEKFNIDPKNVVLEIGEDKIEDVSALKQFINTYRSNGFLVALNDIGCGFSNLDKIPQVEPDIVKISEKITENINMDYYKQEIFKSLVNLSKKISALVIADGIDTEEQAFIALELGADMLQGNYFSKFDDISKMDSSETQSKIKSIASQYKKYMYEQIKIDRNKHVKFDKIISSIINTLSKSKENEFNNVLNKALKDYQDYFECVYILDKNGMQVSDSVTYIKDLMTQKALIFKPAKRGADHSAKKYYYYLSDMGLDKYVTEPYISLASGNLCITISQKFKNIGNREYVLCVDFNPNAI